MIERTRQDSLPFFIQFIILYILFVWIEDNLIFSECWTVVQCGLVGRWSIINNQHIKKILLLRLYLRTVTHLPKFLTGRG